MNARLMKLRVYDLAIAFLALGMAFGVLLKGAF